MMQAPQQQPQPQGQAPAQGNPNSQQVQGPQLGDITGDPALDQALADTMSAIPKGGDQIMSNLLAALQPYLAQPGTEQAQANPMAQG